MLMSIMERGRIRRDGTGGSARFDAPPWAAHAGRRGAQLPRPCTPNTKGGNGTRAEAAERETFCIRQAMLAGSASSVTFLRRAAHPGPVQGHDHGIAKTGVARRRGCPARNHHHIGPDADAPALGTDRLAQPPPDSVARNGAAEPPAHGQPQTHALGAVGTRVQDEECGRAAGAFAIHAAKVFLSGQTAKPESGHLSALPGNGQPVPPLRPPALQRLAPARGAHARAKAVHAPALPLLWLKGALHLRTSATEQAHYSTVPMLRQRAL